MARVAFAWELGAGLGHIVPCWDLGTELTRRGHDIAFVLRQPEALRRLPGGDAYPLLQAPRDPHEGEVAQAPVTYAEILLSCGYASAASLRPLVDGWVEAFETLRPDFIVEDYAPTALLAGRILGIRRARCANGFSIPPRTTPLPLFRNDLEVAPSRIADSEARALASVNAVLGAYGKPALARLCDMLSCDEDFLCTLPEVDHYGNRPPAGYWGPRVRFHVGEEVDWPRGQGPCIFVYLHDSPAIDATLEAISRRACRLIAYIPGITPERVARYEGPGRVFARQMVRIDRLLPGCDLVVSHGGTLCPGSILGGIPQYVLPQHIEQFITARRIEQTGVGGWVGPEASVALASQMFDALLSQPRFREAARAFARRYSAFSAADQKRRIVQRIEELLAA